MTVHLIFADNKLIFFSKAFIVDRLVHPCCERLAFFVDSFAIFLRPFSFQCPDFITFKFFEFPRMSDSLLFKTFLSLLYCYSAVFLVALQGRDGPILSPVSVFFCCFALP